MSVRVPAIRAALIIKTRMLLLLLLYVVAEAGKKVRYREVFARDLYDVVNAYAPFSRNSEIRTRTFPGRT